MQTSAHKNLKKFPAGKQEGRTPQHHTAPTEPTPHQLKIKQKLTPHPERE